MARLPIPGLDIVDFDVGGLGGAIYNGGMDKINDKVNSKLDPLFDDIRDALDVSDTGFGRELSKLGLPTDFSQFLGFGQKSNGWLKKGSALPDPLMQIDWCPSMPLGLPAEYVLEMQVPNANNTPSEGIFTNGSREYFAQIKEHTGLSITFYEDRKLTVTSWLQGWRSLIQNTKGTFNAPSVYKKNIIVTPMDVKGNALATIKIIGCWPSNIPPYTFSSGNSSPMQLAVEFQCDGIIIEVKGASGGGGLGGLLSSFMQGLPLNFTGNARTIASAATSVFNAIF